MSDRIETYFESTGETIPLRDLSAPDFDLVEANLYLFLNDSPSPERAEALHRDLDRLRHALGRIANHE